MIIDELVKAAGEKYAVCVGLDTDYSYLPSYLKAGDVRLSDKIFYFNKAIIDATSDIACCYKIQSAYYEAEGIEGLLAYSKTLSYLKSEGIISIADVKRSDISATASKYAKAIFEGDFEADMATINGYMGVDSIDPFYPYLDNGKAIFVLVRTSNPSASDFEDLDANGQPLYERVASKVEEWGQRFIAKCGFSSIGAVVGINKAEEAESISKAMPHAFLLIPGYGTQGGSGVMLKKLFKNRICGVVNASRSIICAHMSQGLDKGFEIAARKAARDMQADIKKWL